MENYAIRRSSFWLFTTPIFLACILVRLINYRSIIQDFKRCEGYISLVIIDPEVINDSLVRAMILAEDHRSSYHYGVDQFAIARAVYTKLGRNVTQGASTVEQQFVRTLSGRYERTFRRKLREQLISVMLCARFSKRDIAEAYLSCAYFGTGLQGEDGIRKIRGLDIHMGDESVIACLKYPVPRNLTDKYFNKLLKRVNYIKALVEEKKDGVNFVKGDRLIYEHKE